MKLKMWKYLAVLLLYINFCSSCAKLISIDTPQNQLTTDKVFQDASSASAAMVSAYALFEKTIDPNYNKFMSFYTDELSYSGTTQEYLDYTLSAIYPTNTTNLNNWKNNYFAIYQCNDIIEQLQKSISLPTATVIEYTNEAKFLRAFSYFYLVNTYNTNPLILQTDVNLNAKSTNSDSATIYKQIVQDLKDAQDGLSASYIGSGRVRANKYASTALLARVYLFQQDWVNAESSATSVINSGLYTPLPATSNTFLANSQETILAFWTQTGFISDAPSFIPSSGTPNYYFTNSQLNAFEAGDLRKTNWTNSVLVGSTNYRYPYKYHNRIANTTAPEYLIALRAAEQYLIRAEARAQQGNISGVSGAIADLNVVRNRAGLGNYIGALDKQTVLATILHERRTELFTEWGHRFLDLKRTGLLNSLLASYKPNWKSTGTTLPIPQNELNTNPILKQNTGY